MAENVAFDAGHISFLELIRSLSRMAGPAFATGALLRTGVHAGEAAPLAEFANWEEFLESIEKAANPIAQFEGKAKHFGNGVFGLPVCPFAGSISTFRGFRGALPDEYKEVTRHFNKPTPQSEKYRVAEGAGVSPFCCVHQPIRSALGMRVKIGGCHLRIYQLGCKSGTGYKGLAERWTKEMGADRALVERILDDNMCCYGVQIIDGAA